MRFLTFSAAKLNLSLRVTSQRPDGYHNIVSLFARLPSVEALHVVPTEGQDCVRAQGLELKGENIVARALRCAREAGLRVPFFDVEVIKNIPPGSGLGAGSGNGAAILDFLAPDRDDPVWRGVALKTGADVPFLFSGAPLGLVSGIGEQIEPLRPLSMDAVVVFPDWGVRTENAYAQLDRRYVDGYPMDEPAARHEADGLCQKLRSGEKIGMLPNDFAPGLIERFPDYASLFNLFEACGGRAWGITGSGGAAFALGCEPAALKALTWPDWTAQVFSGKI